MRRRAPCGDATALWPATEHGNSVPSPRAGEGQGEGEQAPRHAKPWPRRVSRRILGWKCLAGRNGQKALGAHPMRPFAIALLVLLAGCSSVPIENDRHGKYAPLNIRDSAPRVRPVPWTENDNVVSPFEPPGRRFNIAGKVLAVDAGSFTVDDPGNGATILPITWLTSTDVVLSWPSTDIRPGQYVGTASIPGPDGRHQATSITVYDELPRAYRELPRDDYSWFGQYIRPSLPGTPPVTMTAGVAARSTRTEGGIVVGIQYLTGEIDVFVPAGLPFQAEYRVSESFLEPGHDVTVTVFKPAAEDVLQVEHVTVHRVITN